MLGLGLDIGTFIALLIALVIALSMHEFAHAWTANYLGDDTPRAYGRLTLNPLAHLDPIGSLLLVFAGFGWAKPVPVNPYNLNRRSPAGLMWVSLAGPASNFLMAVVAAIPLRLGLEFSSSSNSLDSLWLFLFYFIQINLGLMLFNLLPLAPLDGEKIAIYLLPPAWGRALEKIAPYGSIILLVVLFVLPRMNVDVFGMIISPVVESLTSLLLGV
jgi:Zn-dependent protease